MARLAGWLKRLTERLTERLTVQRIAAVLVVVGVVVFVAGVVNKHCACAGLPNLSETLNDVISDFYANVSVDCLSIAFAILVIDRLNERRAEKELKAQLIREMGSPDNGIALQAVRELIVNEWLSDGSLKGVSLRGANLAGAELVGANLQESDLAKASFYNANMACINLQKAQLTFVNFQKAYLSAAVLEEALLPRANLQEAHLVNANLQKGFMTEVSLQNANLSNSNLQKANLYQANLLGAVLKGANLTGAILSNAYNLTDEQFSTASALCGARMPDRSRYNGRFNLTRDIENARRGGVNHDDPEAMARFYSVPLETYLTGQEWACKHLERVRHKGQEYAAEYSRRWFLTKDIENARRGGVNPDDLEAMARYYDVPLSGQEWARENLPRLRRRAGLDPDTGRPVEPTNGAEPQPTDAPAQPAPRRNGHKASMVAHRVRR